MPGSGKEPAHWDDAQRGYRSKKLTYIHGAYLVITGSGSSGSPHVVYGGGEQ